MNFFSGELLSVNVGRHGCIHAHRPEVAAAAAAAAAGGLRCV